MSDKEIRTEYENAVLSMAVSEMMDDIGKQLIEEAKSAENIIPSAEARSKFEKALDKSYRKGKISSLKKSVSKASRYFLTACAAAIIVVAVSVVSVDAFRIKFIEWLANIGGGYNTVDFTDQSHNDTILPENIPDKYILNSYTNNDNIIRYQYISSDNKNFNITQYTHSTTINIDNEDLNEYKELIYNNQVYYIKRKNETIYVVWTTDNNSYSLFTNDAGISEELIVEISQSLE